MTIPPDACPFGDLPVGSEYTHLDGDGTRYRKTRAGRVRIVGSMTDLNAPSPWLLVRPVGDVPGDINAPDTTLRTARAEVIAAAREVLRVANNNDLEWPVIEDLEAALKRHDALIPTGGAYTGDSTPAADPATMDP